MDLAPCSNASNLLACAEISHLGYNWCSFREIQHLGQLATSYLCASQRRKLYQHIGRFKVPVDDGGVGCVEESAALGNVLCDLEHHQRPSLLYRRSSLSPLVPMEQLEEITLEVDWHMKKRSA